MTVGQALEENEGSKVKVVVDDTGTLSDRLRAAADLLDGSS